MQRTHHYLPVLVIGLILLIALAWQMMGSGAAALSTRADRPVTPPLTCGLAWRVVPSPNVGSGNNRLLSIAAVAANDVWAVGTTGTMIGGGLILHWDGNQWSVVPVPDPGTYVQLTAISALAANDIWAVGNYTNSGPRLLTLHWDGTLWSQVPSPSPGYNYTNNLYSVAAIAPNDVWTAGFYRNYSPQGLFMHWDGTQWSVVASPYQPSINWFQDLAPVAPNNVWAVGLLTGQTPGQSVIFQWNGTAWNPVASPDISNLNGVSAYTANDIWAVGLNGILHWDGAAWSTSSTSAHNLNGVKALAADNAWAVGTDSIVHWDGISWSAVPTPTVGSLSRIASLGAADLWAVGSYNNGGVTQTLIEHYSDPCAGGTPTPTSVSSSSTPTPLTSPTPSVTPTYTPDCAPGWNLAPSPNANIWDELHGVTVVAPNDIWAVGWSADTNQEQTLTLHWNGTTWSVVPSPNLGVGENNRLYSVAAVGTNDVWAVGTHEHNRLGGTVILHWDGQSWTAVPNPDPSPYAEFFGIAAVAANDIWAVGDDRNFTLISHWNGSSWAVVFSPTVPDEDTLYSVTALAANDVWAVGVTRRVGSNVPLTEHWDGSTWQPDYTPSTGTYAALSAVEGVAADDVWAVGYSDDQPLTLHWHGGLWSIVPAPAGSVTNHLAGVVALAANDVWAVGEADSQARVLHWTGSTWGVVPIPGVVQFNSLAAIAAVNANDLWTVGASANSGYRQTLIEHYLTVCPSATPTGTPPTATATSTRVPPAITLTPTHAPPTASATACPLLFGDVAPSDPFYPYIRCLACRQILSGYSTSPPCAQGGAPCFQGGASITRGQVAKIVANAAGFSDAIPSTQQTFADVPSSSPFWLYIERAALHGVISGYTASPPCMTGVPCFLPGNPLTRGQLAKIDANAAGFVESIPSTQQTFTDVAYGSPFWLYVERASLHGLISGYSTSPPCPGGVPCFLPGNSVTRNQTAKIVANGFFPACQTPQR